MEFINKLNKSQLETLVHLNMQSTSVRELKSCDFLQPVIKDHYSILSDWKKTMTEIVTGCLRMMKSCHSCIKKLKRISS